MGVRNILGKIGSERGAENEERALRVLNSYQKPEWLHEVIKATYEEDQEGIDIVCHSDVGKLFLQIKSSETGRINAKNDRNKAIVVINAKMDDQEVSAKLIGALSSIRSYFRKQRGQE